MYLAQQLAIVAVACSLASAAPVVGKVSTAPGLLINDKGTPQKIAPTWPVVINDKVATTSERAILVLTNRDRALLDPNTSVQLVERDGVLTLEVIGGKLCLDTTRHSNLQVYAAGQQLTINRPFAGSITLIAPQEKASIEAGDCNVRTGGLWTSKKAIIPVAGGAAAAAATGAAISQASPTK